MKDQYITLHFTQPNRRWIENIANPTINFFLFDLTENTELRQLAPQSKRGSTRLHMPPRRFDLSYLVSTFAPIEADQYEILWSTLASLIEHQYLPEEILSPVLKQLDPPISTRIGPTEKDVRVLELWSNLEIPPHPSFLYVVTVPLDLKLMKQVPLVLEHGVSLESRLNLTGLIQDARMRPIPNLTVVYSSIVKNKFKAKSQDSQTTTNTVGQFSFRDLPPSSGTLAISVDEDEIYKTHLRRPQDNYVVTLDTYFYGKGSVRNREGKLLPDVTIYEKGFEDRVFKTNAGGIFNILHQPVSHVTLIAIDSAGRKIEKKFTTDQTSYDFALDDLPKNADD